MRSLGLLLLLSTSASAVDLRSMLSPGVLNRAHDPFAGDCDQCHLVFDGVPDAKCNDCHTAIADRISLDRGFHARHSTEPCVDCHRDHGGFDASLTTEEATKAFDHAATGFSVAGGHSTLSCDQCHTGPLEKMAASCGTCHSDPHAGALGPDCGECHTDKGWKEGLKTLADHDVPTDGGHQGLGCADCHKVGLLLDDTVACAQCHDQGHDGTTSPCDDCHQVAAWKPAKFDHGPCTCAFPGKHQTVGCLECHAEFDFTDTPEICSGCHLDDRKHDDLGECARCHDALSWSASTFDHDRKTTFPIVGKHQAVSCTQCHPQAGVFGGQQTVCASCHAEDGEEAHGDFGACERCHSPAGFAPSTFDHATTGFPLTGKHAGAPCQQCHRDKVKGYSPTP